MVNFVTISQSVAEIWRFIFSAWRPSAILDLFCAYLGHLQTPFDDLYCCSKFG